MDKYQNKISIRHWAENDQPREKLLIKGKSILSEAELIAILLRSGSRTNSALDLAMIILNSASNSITQLGKISANELMKIPGMGPAKAASVVAALELGRRRKEHDISINKSVRSSKHAFEIIKDVFYDLSHEEFWIIVLSRNNDVIGRKKISQGGVSGTVADNKLIFKYALEHLSSSIIVFHNHPSGNLKPSKADEELTKKIKIAAKNLDISLLDHIIVHNEQYFSFADEGLL